MYSGSRRSSIAMPGLSKRIGSNSRASSFNTNLVREQYQHKDNNTSGSRRDIRHTLLSCVLKEMGTSAESAQQQQYLTGSSQGLGQGQIQILSGTGSGLISGPGMWMGPGPGVWTGPGTGQGTQVGTGVGTQTGTGVGTPIDDRSMRAVSASVSSDAGEIKYGDKYSRLPPRSLWTNSMSDKKEVEADKDYDSDDSFRNTPDYKNALVSHTLSAKALTTQNLLHASVHTRTGTKGQDYSGETSVVEPISPKSWRG